MTTIFDKYLTGFNTEKARTSSQRIQWKTTERDLLNSLTYFGNETCVKLFKDSDNVWVYAKYRGYRTCKFIDFIRFDFESGTVSLLGNYSEVNGNPSVRAYIGTNSRPLKSRPRWDRGLDTYNLCLLTLAYTPSSVVGDFDEFATKVLEVCHAASPQYNDWNRERVENLRAKSGADNRPEAWKD